MGGNKRVEYEALNKMRGCWHVHSLLKDRQATATMGIYIMNKMQKGQTLVEYALILALISLIVVTTLGLFGNQILNAYNYVVNSLGNAT